MDRSAAAKVSPAFSFTCTCTIPWIRYSTGSSTVTMFTPSLCTCRSAEYSVVVLPEPVGPVTRMTPSRLSSKDLIVAPSSWLRPRESSDSTMRLASRIRRTTFSPSVAGRVETRRATGTPLTATPAPPSPGRRRPPMAGGGRRVRDGEGGDDLHPREQRQARRPRDLHHLAQHPVNAVPHRNPAFFRLDVDVAGPGENAFGQDQVHQPYHRPLRGLLGRDGDLVQRVPVLQLGHLGVRVHALAASRERQRLLAVEIERVGRGDLEIGIRDPKGEDVVFAGRLLGHQLARLLLAVGDVRKLQTEARGEPADQLLVSCLALGDHRLPERFLSAFDAAKLLQRLRADQLLDRGAEPLVFEAGYGTPPGGRATLLHVEDKRPAGGRHCEEPHQGGQSRGQSP